MANSAFAIALGDSFSFREAGSVFVLLLGAWVAVSFLLDIGSFLGGIVARIVL